MCNTNKSTKDGDTKYETKTTKTTSHLQHREHKTKGSLKNKHLQRMKETPRTEGANTSTRTAICVMQMRLEIKQQQTMARCAGAVPREKRF